MLLFWRSKDDGWNKGKLESVLGPDAGGFGDRGPERAGVWMRRIVDNVHNETRFNNPSLAHNNRVVADLAGKRDVMRDEEIGESFLFFERRPEGQRSERGQTRRATLPAHRKRGAWA